MKIALALSFLVFSSTVAFGQTATDSDQRQNYERHHNYSWIGLLGLAGLAGLRRPKSIEHERMAASGIKVKTV